MQESMREPERTAATGASAGELPPIGGSEPEWRPSDQPALQGANGAASAWSSPEAPATDVVSAGGGRPPADPRSFVGPEDTPSRGLRKPPIPSVATIAGHPLHPMVVPFPIGALTFALASDLAYVATGDRFWARASTILLGTGIATGALAGALGATGYTGREAIREKKEAQFHAFGNIAALTLSAMNLASRRSDPEGSIKPAGLAMSLLTGSILVVTGWLGGELSYRHRVGVTAD